MLTRTPDEVGKGPGCPLPAPRLARHRSLHANRLRRRPSPAFPRPPQESKIAERQEARAIMLEQWNFRKARLGGSDSP